MSMSVEAKILETIKDTLPEATAGELRKYLDTGAKIAMDLGEANKKSDRLSEELKVKTEKIEDLEKDLEVLNSLKLREEEIGNRERDLEITILNVKLTESEQRNIVVGELVQKVFGHPSVTVSSSSSETKLSPDTGMVTTDNSTEFQTTTESKV